MSAPCIVHTYDKVPFLSQGHFVLIEQLLQNAFLYETMLSLRSFETG
jgi:hypothetical protein